MIRGIYSNDSGEWFVDEQFPTDTGTMSAIKTRPATAEEIAFVEGITGAAADRLLGIAPEPTEAAETEFNQPSGA